MTEPSFPPLMAGHAASGAEDPFALASQKAVLGCDAGLIVHNLASDRLSVALVCAPEVPLAKAMTMLPISGIAFQNALGALAPPEVAVHLQWDGGIRINGGRCGHLRVAASTNDPTTTPDWLVIALDLALWPPSDVETGTTPEDTALYAEGCADVDAVGLLESYARHALHWITRWEDDGTEPVHSTWRGLVHGIGDDLSQGSLTGTFLGVDENFGLLLRDAETTHLIPLTTLLETP
ncbi:DUF4444 domain-containing protein [Phaeobacter sp. C3_T13_0]|uniref:biotin/lipoate--protein ligase family protein n=1 Tax=Phaeobacter cretensis TaxID=3342641 RepID=UPI0039BD8553